MSSHLNSVAAQSAWGRGMPDQRKLAVGQELARLRKDAGLTQTDVGLAIDKSVGRISQIERGNWVATPEKPLITLYVEHCLKHLDASPEVRTRRRAHVMGQFAALD